MCSHPVLQCWLRWDAPQSSSVQTTHTLCTVLINILTKPFFIFPPHLPELDITRLEKFPIHVKNIVLAFQMSAESIGYDHLDDYTVHMHC